MPIHNVRFTPSTYDSENNNPPWRDFTSQFESFVMYQDGGAAIIALIDHILHRERALIASSKLDHGILLSEDEINAFNRAATAAQVDNGEVAVARATIESYSNLSEDEKLLDSSLYNILDSCISGPLRTALSGVQIRSFVQAWVLIQKEQGATNSQRKTELVGRLMNIVYNPSEQNSAQFKASNLNIVREIYDARVTLEDIIMTSIMNSLPRGGYQSARITFVPGLSARRVQSRGHHFD